METSQKQLLQRIAKGAGKITVLTGAGISAESGIPTFRGPEGYWTVGSEVYHPQEMATFQMFSQIPEEVWKWYLYRMGVCKGARPNDGHKALVDMENVFKDRFALITQNIDGLHLSAGNSLQRTYQIHGNVFHMRCALECSEEVYPIPETVSPKTKEEQLTAQDIQALRCPLCGARTRPHVLLFDESYNEHHYHFYSSMAGSLLTSTLRPTPSQSLPNKASRDSLSNSPAPQPCRNCWIFSPKGNDFCPASVVAGGN